MDTTAAKIPETPNSTPTILVAEDEDVIRELIATSLETKGYQVFAAATGAAAIEIWKLLNPKPTLLIADLAMPGMNGPELAIKLRQMQAGIKVLFVTGAGFDLMDQALIAFRDSKLVRKPFQPDHLIATIEAVLAEK